MTTATKDTIYTALLAVQAEAPTLQKSSINPHFKSKFVPLDAVHEAVMPLLNKNGLAWVTLPGVSEGGNPVLRYRLIHAATGEEVTGTMPLLPTKQDPQGQGSAITYARRYSLMAVLGLVADEDDDGNKASEGGPSKAGAKASRSKERGAPVQAAPSLGDLSDAELEAATGGKVLHVVDADAVKVLYERAKAAGYTDGAWQAKVRSAGITGADDFTVEAATDITAWIERKEAKKAA